MPTPIHPPIAPAMIACAVCRKEIPLSSALTPQGAEYVSYFCGIECLAEFQAERQSTAASDESEKPQK